MADFGGSLSRIDVPPRRAGRSRRLYLETAVLAARRNSSANPKSHMTKNAVTPSTRRASSLEVTACVQTINAITETDA